MTILNQYYYVLCSVKCRVPDSGHQGPAFEILEKQKKEKKFHFRICEIIIERFCFLNKNFWRHLTTLSDDIGPFEMDASFYI